MGVLYALLFIIVIVPVINLCIAAFKNPSYDNIIKVGHRGAAGLAPENTLPAIDSGLATGANYIEVDVRETRDGQLVIMHDKKVNRTTNGAGAVHQLDYQEINKLNAAEGLAGYTANAKVPLLQEALLRIKDSNAKLLIEIKDPALYPQLVDKLVRLIAETGTVDKVAVFSFDRNIVKQVKKQLPGIQTGFFCIGPECSGETADFIGANWMSLLYTPSLVNRIHKQGAKVLVWTPNQTYWMKYLCKMKVDGIITDRPDILNTVIANHVTNN